MTDENKMWWMLLGMTGFGIITGLYRDALYFQFGVGGLILFSVGFGYYAGLAKKQDVSLEDCETEVKKDE